METEHDVDRPVEPSETSEKLGAGRGDGFVSGDRLDARVREYWSWIAVALFLLITVDMITTTYAAYRFGVVNESNPLVRWALVQGPAVFAGVNLLAVVLVTVLFDRVVELLGRTPEPYDRYLAAGIEAWLGGLLAAGLLVFANNLAVIFFGRSLL